MEASLNPLRFGWMLTSLTSLTSLTNMLIALRVQAG
jgi:hypothetical protein